MKETLNKACPVVFLNRFLSRGQTTKHDIQDWLDTIKFGLHITIEPTPWSPVVDDEVRQRLRQVEMNINRKFIGNKFSKFRDWYDRFWYAGFFEGQGKWRHSHVLLYLPYQRMNVVGNHNYRRMTVSRTFVTEWFQIPSINYLGCRKDISTPYTQKIKRKINSVRCSRYDSKELHNKDAYEDYFFSTM